MMMMINYAMNDMMKYISYVDDDDDDDDDE